MSFPLRSLVAAPSGEAVAPAPAVTSGTGTWEELALRCGMVATGAFLLRMALALWAEAQIATHPEWIWIIFLQYGLAFGSIGAAVLPFRIVSRWSPVVCAAVLLSIALWSYARIEMSQRDYGTDNAALSHVAGERILRGENPYAVHDRSVIEAAADRFGVPRTFVTATTDGEPLTNLMSWPAGAVLLVIPALALGIDDVRWTVVLFEILTLLVLWLQAPAALRPLSLVALLVDPDLLLQFTAGGVMDFLWVLPMLLAAIALYDGRLNRAALLYGFAAGIKQQPWLLAPFLAIWLWHTHRNEPVTARLGVVANFGAVALGGFAVLNLPFVIWDPADWLRGVLLPFHEQLVPFGSGISLLTQAGIVDLPKSFYSAATFGIWGLLVLIYALYFRTAMHLLWIAPALVMWFGYRGLQNYYIYWTPIILVALFRWWEQERSGTAEPVRIDRAMPTRHRFLRLLPVPAAMAALVTALALIAINGSRQEQLRVDMRVLSMRDQWQIGATTKATVELFNTGETEVRPRFAVAWLPYPYYWRVVSGPPILAPGQRASYQIESPDSTSAPPNGQEFVIKVNNANNIVSVASPPLREEEPSLPVLNPRLRLWTQRNMATGMTSPAGWQSYARRGSRDQTALGPSAVMGSDAARFHVVQDGRKDPDGWAHTGLLQEVAFPQVAFTIKVLSRAPFRATDTGWPLTAFGMEIADADNGLIWLLFQQTGLGNVEYDLPTGHHIKVIDVPPNEWTTQTVDLASLYHELNWSPSERITMKLFAAAASSAANDVDGYVAWLDVPATATIAQ